MILDARYLILDEEKVVLGASSRCAGLRPPKGDALEKA